MEGWVLEKLRSKSKGNFLYAKLMVEWLREDDFTVDDILQLMGSRVPDKLSEIYTQSFRQYRADQFKYTRYAINPSPTPPRPPLCTGVESSQPSLLIGRLCSTSTSTA